MRRTRENWLTEQPLDRNEISSLRFFDGEDLHYQERKKAFQETQRKWLEMQKLEKNLRDQERLANERLYASQTLQLNRMRGVLEDDLEAKKREVQASTRDFNKKVELEKQEKKNREKAQKVREEAEDLKRQMAIRQLPPYSNPLV